MDASSRPGQHRSRVTTSSNVIRNGEPATCRSAVMRPLTAFSILVLVTLAGPLAGLASASPAGFTNMPAPIIDVRAPQSPVFPDPVLTHLISRGDSSSGVIDLDSKWKAQRSGVTADLYAVAFPDDLHGWAVGDSGTILATDDGGATWVAQDSGTTETLSDVDFADSTHGWAVGGTSWGGGDGCSSVIVATADGGRTWKTQRIGSTEDLEGVSFSDPTHGWAVGGYSNDAQRSSTGCILSTTNGGATWRKQDAGTRAVFDDVAFIDASRGWAVGSSAERETSYVIATNDGGDTWRTQKAFTWTSDGVPMALAFSDGSSGCTVGASGTIWTTDNGGRAWTKRILKGGQTRGRHLRDVALPDPAHGWIAGDNGLILSTHNGGATWARHDIDKSCTLDGLAFPDSLHAWAVGTGGTIYSAAIQDTVRPSIVALNAVQTSPDRETVIRYRVDDPAPSCGRATVSLVIKRKDLSVAWETTIPTAATNRTLSYGFSCPLPAGLYRYYLSCTDAAGNEGTNVSSRGFRVF